jgi:hypothetical protein
MSLLDTLLRAHRRRCEERRRRLAELEELAERLRADAERLREAIDAAAVDQFATGQLVLRHATVERSIAAIEIQIGSAAAALVLAEAELRQSERAAARRDSAAGPGDARGKRRGRRKQPPAQPGVGHDHGD